MKITICGSIAFFDEMLEIKKHLEELGHEVKLPPSEIAGEDGVAIPIKQYYKLRKAEKGDSGWIWDRKEEAMKRHFDKVVWSYAILVLNYTKNDIKNYVGANTFLEMGLAFHHKKKIYLLNEIPEISCKEEILDMKPVVINNDLTKIK
ncbi:hypothetical protein CL630_00500 [bacterium]|nr:hypothetical protein [bacterium]|tara:strand:- start:38245 stop:38688 length:444 start_codon:yes stop_codon:yes gene_type:complete